MDAGIDSGMADLFNFGEASLPLALDGNHRPTIGDPNLLLLNGTDEQCLPPLIVENFGVQQTDEITAGDLSNFAKWIPRYSKPDAPCGYCRSRNLQCWFTFENQTSCSACCALFRPCSFAVEGLDPILLMDTLHVVHEDAVQDNGELTGVKALRSWDRTPLDARQSIDDRPTGKTGTRFPREATTILKDWVAMHRNHPYPTEEEKEDLSQRTGLSVGQISNWLANCRRRNKIRRCRGVSPSIRSPIKISSGAIDIPVRNHGSMDGKAWQELNPLERWKASPPDNEPASFSDIAVAVARSDLRSSDSSGVRANSRNLESSAGSSSFSVARALSITSLDTGRSDSQLSSSLSNLSAGSSRSLGSRNSYRSGSGSRREHRRRRRANPSVTPATLRPFQCTFCTDTFRTKFDWMRHEKSLHLNLDKYICAPLGPIIMSSPSNGEPTTTCVFCGESNPTTEHLETHNYRECGEKSIAGRTFYRKDHLAQHIRLVHGCKLIPVMDSWKSEAAYIRCRCGFCDQKFTSWSDRCDHLAKHFRSGSKMRDWKGCRGFDENVASMVKNAMPPYLIWGESNSMEPFSASNEGNMQAPIDVSNLEGLVTTESDLERFADWNRSIDCPADLVPADPLLPDLLTYPDLLQGGGTTHNIGPLAPRVSTCWEILTLRLGLFVKEQLQAGIIPTDGMLQRQARWILYETDDNWNQTAADNQEWLELFKKAHGLPSTSTDPKVDMMEDLGVGIGDLNFDSFLDGSWETGAGNEFIGTGMLAGMG